jgi:hypothetical protein
VIAWLVCFVLGHAEPRAKFFIHSATYYGTFPVCSRCEARL